MVRKSHTAEGRSLLQSTLRSSLEIYNREEQFALESAMRAAREAYLNGHDPTSGATHFSIETTPSRANKIYKKGTREGVPITTQSGPYYNSYLGRDVKSHVAWLNTYGSEYKKEK
jgi:hypothetical protein